jgi:hypothetical protein
MTPMEDNVNYTWRMVLVEKPTKTSDFSWIYMGWKLVYKN